MTDLLEAVLISGYSSFQHSSILTGRDGVTQVISVTEFGERPVRLLGISLSNLDINEEDQAQQLQLSLDK